MSIKQPGNVISFNWIATYNWVHFRLVGIMLQISIMILFWISLKISSLCLLSFFLSLWVYHCSPFTNKWLNTFAIYETFLHSITPLSLSSWTLTSSKSLTFLTSSTVLEVEMSLFCYFLTYFSFWQFFYSNLLCSIFYGYKTVWYLF